MLFIDNNMSKMSGIEFVEHLQNKGCKGLTQNKMVMSGYLEKADIEKAKELGCIIVNKSINFDQIDEIIHEVEKTINPNRKLADLSSA